MDDNLPDTGPETILEVTPSNLSKLILVGLVGAAVGIALGYMVGKILEEDRLGHYEPTHEVRVEEVDTPDAVEEAELEVEEHPSLLGEITTEE